MRATKIQSDRAKQKRLGGILTFDTHIAYIATSEKQFVTHISKREFHSLSKLKNAQNQFLSALYYTKTTIINIIKLSQKIDLRLPSSLDHHL